MENYEVKNIVNLPYEEIDRIQQNFDRRNVQYIEKAFQDHRINTEDRDYLLNFYHDGMAVYREVYRALYEMFRQPENTCAIDLGSGKVDTDEHGAHINYGLKAVTPFTCTRLEYVDKFHNPIYVVFPKMKSAERAVEKIESEYQPKYNQEMEKIFDRFFEDEDREKLIEKIQSVPKSSTKLRDILRLTITCKYFTDVERIKRIMSNNNIHDRNFYIDENETRDGFYKPLAKNEKKYYDIKMIMHQKTANGKPIDVEVQLKIDTLYNADMRTHKIYEDVRRIEGELALKAHNLPQNETRHKEAQIKILKNRIRTINENAIHQYNMMVLDKARRIEDDGYRPLRVTPDHPDGTYQQCRTVISNEYMVESFDKFDPKIAFTAEADVNKLAFLRMIGKVENTFNETDDHASEVINAHFKQLTPSEKERFNGINEVAERYAPIIQQKILSRQKEESIGNPKPISMIDLNNSGR